MTISFEFVKAVFRRLEQASKTQPFFIFPQRCFQYNSRKGWVAGMVSILVPIAADRNYKKNIYQFSQLFLLHPALKDTSEISEKSLAFFEIHCITCKLCKNSEPERKPTDRFIPRNVGRNDKDASKPISRHFNLPNHSSHNMTICGLLLHQGNIKSLKNLKQTFIFQQGNLTPYGFGDAFHYINRSVWSYRHRFPH